MSYFGAHLMRLESRAGQEKILANPGTKHEAARSPNLFHNCASCNLGIRKLGVSKRGRSWALREWSQVAVRRFSLKRFLRSPRQDDEDDDMSTRMMTGMMTCRQGCRSDKMTFNWSLFLRTHSICPCVSREVFPENLLCL